MRPSPIAGLTRRRLETLQALTAFLGRTGRYPTGVELAETTGRSPHSTWYALRALGREGLIHLRGRQYTLTPTGLEVARTLGRTVWRDDPDVQKALRLIELEKEILEKRTEDAAEDNGR